MVTLDDSLRVAQVVLNILTVTSGLMTSISLGWTVKIFSENCLLYTTIVLIPGANETVKIDSHGTDWAPVEICYYCVFTSVLAAIYSIIWFWFYLLLSEWQSTEPDSTKITINKLTRVVYYDTAERPSPDRKLFIPALLLNVVLFVCCAISLGMVTRGGSIWCDHVSTSLGKPCSYVGNERTNWIIPGGNEVYGYLRIAQAGGWILLMAILAKVVVISSRLYLSLRTVVTVQAKPSTGDTRAVVNDGEVDAIRNLGDQSTSVRDRRRGQTNESQNESGSDVGSKDVVVTEETKLLPETKKKYHTY